MPNPAYSIPESTTDAENALENPSIMDTFKQRVEKFWSTYKQLQARENEVPAKLRPEYDAVMNKGARIRSTIESITNTYDAAAEWLSDVFGFGSADFGLDGVQWRDAFSGNLGALPFVPLAVIAGASTFIVKWLKDAYTMERKLNEQKRLEAQGYDSARAAEIVNKTVTGPGLFSVRFNMKPLIIVGGIGFGIWYANRKGWI